MPPRARRRARTGEPRFECVATIRGHVRRETIYGVAVTPDGRIVYGCSDNALKVLRNGVAAMTLTGHADAITKVLALSDDCVVSGSRDTNLRVWDLKTYRCVQVLTDHPHVITALAALSGGRIISASGDMRHTLETTQKIWDLATGRCLKTLDFRDTYSIVPLPNGLVVTATHYSVAVWDLDKDAVEECWLYGTPNGRDEENWVSLDREGRSAELMGHTFFVWSVAMLPDGRVVSGSADSTMRVWDLPVDPDDLVIPDYDEENDCWPDFDLAIHNYVDGTIFGRCVQTIVGHRGSVNCVTAAPGGCFVSASDDHTLITWNASTGRPIQKLAGHSDGVLFVTVMPDGRLLSASRNGELKLWVDLTRDEAKKMALQIARQRACPDVAKTIAAFL